MCVDVWEVEAERWRQEVRGKVGEVRGKAGRRGGRRQRGGGAWSAMCVCNPVFCNLFSATCFF